jgi:hydrogenase-4 component B
MSRPESLLLAMLLGHAFGVAGALLASTSGQARRLGSLGAIVGASAGLALGLDTLLGGAPLRVELPWLLDLAGGVSLQLDRLGALFLVVVEVVAVPASLYGAAYTRVYEGTSSSLRLLGAMSNLFLLAMALVPLADSIVTFLFCWELMSVASYFLVLTESDRRDTRQASLWYLAMAHGGLVLAMAAFLLLGAGAASTGFADLRGAASTLPTFTRNVVFLLALLGFGSKAGLVPLHVWLPLAHPAAPSHVSALMSGAMVKLGIYGLLRITLDLLGGGPAWWGGTVLVAGAVSALLGVLYALMEQDLKKLLAYSTVENVGIICLAIGAGLLFHSYGLPALALLGLVAGLYHALNHACFKGLLFLGAGAVLHATHTRNMEALGGLIKGMPRTALGFLLGAVAISGLPPLNGFVSEWLVFQTLLGGIGLPRAELAILMPLAVGVLALTSGLAAACFVKAFGISFLAIPRSTRAVEAREVPWPMQVGMGALAFACVALGVVPSLVVPVLSGTLAGRGGLPADLPPAPPAWTLAMPATTGVIAPAALAGGLALIAVGVALALRLGADRRLRIGDTWGCGRIGQTPRMEYTATAFAEPLRRVFAELYRPTEDLAIDFHPESRYFVQSIAYRSAVHPWFERILYAPVVGLLRRTAFRIRWLQGGSLHLYLLYMILALLALLLVAQWTG